ncbi:hypothetical protein QBC36DRAFT_376274 [Triangularia setosa]|uniref:Uncharacterized protein n=1 Tax=Triangularia setosa TaxID=2587417 RepID=A0AAN7AB20_9PEZI|nr:hypothetical protein QBC36DRAFT_376274 [Podospora setosa]
MARLLHAQTGFTTITIKPTTFGFHVSNLCSGQHHHGRPAQHPAFEFDDTRRMLQRILPDVFVDTDLTRLITIASDALVQVLQSTRLPSFVSATNGMPVALRAKTTSSLRTGDAVKLEVALYLEAWSWPPLLNHGVTDLVYTHQSPPRKKSSVDHASGVVDDYVLPSGFYRKARPAEKLAVRPPPAPNRLKFSSSSGRNSFAVFFGSGNKVLCCVESDTRSVSRGRKGYDGYFPLDLGMPALEDAELVIKATNEYAATQACYHSCYVKISVVGTPCAPIATHLGHCQPSHTIAPVHHKNLSKVPTRNNDQGAWSSPKPPAQRHQRFSDAIERLTRETFPLAGKRKEG